MQEDCRYAGHSKNLRCGRLLRPEQVRVTGVTRVETPLDLRDAASLLLKSRKLKCVCAMEGVGKQEG
jgi:hypothetical protein